MCGIYGILQTPRLDMDRCILEQMAQSMRHRGPDGHGSFVDSRLMMGMQRLAIIDVDGGRQPLYGEDRNTVVVCNGEIYNFKELRRDLIECGHQFATHSDSEVIVHLYEEFGIDCVSRLSGMFALAIWDRRAETLVLARDRLGIKPLYFANDANRLIFSSELKSILEVPGIDRRINHAALTEYLALGYVPAPMTILEGIEKLEPGSILVVDRNGQRRSRYWQVQHKTDDTIKESDWVKQLTTAMEESVVAQMVSDVPLGAFLSGGVDSSAVVAFMARNSSQPVKTYSIGFDDQSGGDFYNELPYANEVAALFNTDHHEIIVRPDVSELLPELLWYMDEPVADAAFITTYLVSKFAREDVTVILSGVGGDELFGGYRRYWSERLANVYRKVPVSIRKTVLQPLADIMPSDRNSRLMDWFRLAKGFMSGAELAADERYERFVRVFDEQDLGELVESSGHTRSRTLVNAFKAATIDDPIHRMMDLDLQTQLPDDLLMLTDRMSMATSLECRVPLLDDRLVNLALKMPSNMKVRGTRLKHGMKAALRGILPNKIIDRKKRGFGAPVGGWYKNEMASYIDSVLNRKAVEERGLFQWESIERMKQLHRQNRQDYTDHLSSLVNLEIWSRIYLDRETPSAVVDRLRAAEAA